MDLQEGVLVTNNVRLVRLLGQGGMGSVWVGQHLGLGTEVAVKFVTPEVAGRDPSVLERFRQEANAAASISSPHVVRVFDFGAMADGTSYLVMELLKGISLRERLEREQRLDLRRTALVVAQTAKALMAAHEAGIVHRDIKPDNLFLVDAPYEIFVKVLDFGIAKQSARGRVKALTKTGMLMGTPVYMSPELLLSAKDATPQADLWALAVVAYECVVGCMPFRAETAAALGVVLDRAQYEPPSRIRPELPAALDVWFARAFARFPENRFASAAELAQSFGRLAKRHSFENEPTAEAGPDGDEPEEEPGVATAPAPRREPPQALPVGVQGRVAPRPARTQAMLGAALGVLVALGAAGAWLARKGGVDPTGGASATQPALDAPRTASELAPQPTDAADPTPRASAPAADPGARETAGGSAAPAPSSPRAPKTGPRPTSGAPVPAPTGPRAKPQKPSYCNPTNGYNYDSSGIRTIKPECLPYL